MLNSDTLFVPTYLTTEKEVNKAKLIPQNLWDNRENEIIKDNTAII